MKALIKVGYGCNNHCTFCHTLDVRDVEGAAAAIDAKIDRAAKLGYTMVVLSGGEPTARPELVRWAAKSAALGMDFGLVTNGRMLAYPELVERLLKYRLKYVYMSLHGGTARVHNLMVRADAFDQTHAAVKNLAGRGLDFTVNTVVTRQNVEHLKPVVDAMLPFHDAVLKFSMVQPKGGADKLFEHIIPPVALVAARVREAIEYGLARTHGEGPHFAHDGIPFCLLPGHESRYDDLKTHRFATMIEVDEGDFFPVDDRAKVQPEKCSACSLRGPCPGLYAGYREIHGEDEISPVTDRPRSNSFHYTFEASAGTLRSNDFRDCPVYRDGTTPWDRGRVMFVRHEDRLGRFRTDSRDFTDLEIEHTKHALGQVYLDVSRKPAPDDFARDLRHLVRSAVCARCPERDRCAGIFEPVAEDVFTRDDAHVRELLAALEGDVLDVGCGEGPYVGVMADGALAGRIRYTGIDPDPARVETLRAQWPWATLHVTTAEALTPDALYDHVTVLRSWNHLRNPVRAVETFARMLRPGATLTVVDNVAFGLVRGRRHAREAENSSAAFEHYRNDGATEAHAVIARAAGHLVCIERREVSPATSNQWMLRYQNPR